MKRGLRILLLLILIIGITMIFVVMTGSLFIGGLFNPPINKEKAEKVLSDDYEAVCAIVDYMKNSNYVNISIESNDYISDDGNYGTWYVYGDALKEQDTGIKKIKDKDIVKIIDILFKKRSYQNISKDGNTVSFLLWSALDRGKGIAYTLDGNAPTLQFLTESERLKKDNWYYYEENFNEWKAKNDFAQREK